MSARMFKALTVRIRQTGDAQKRFGPVDLSGQKRSHRRVTFEFKRLSEGVHGFVWRVLSAGLRLPKQPSPEWKPANEPDAAGWA